MRDVGLLDGHHFYCRHRWDEVSCTNAGVPKPKQMKWIRDLWGRPTQKKAMKPEVRDMLLSLDGVYEQRTESASSSDPQQATNGPGHT